MKGAYGYRKLWTKRDIEQINYMLRQLNGQKPKEIHRAVRGLKDMKFWKATEFRAFLLYFGIVVLKNYLPAEEYSHFILLNCAVRVCYTNAYKPYVEIAKKWFDKYIQDYINIYGSHSIGSNLHNLNHVVGDVQNFGCLMDNSTYPFENRLQFLKSRVKQANLPLQQITRRLVELSVDYDQVYTTNLSQKSMFPRLVFPYKMNDTLVYKELQLDTNFTLSTRRTVDSWFLTTNNNIVKMKYALKNCEQILIHGTPIEKKEIFFNYPVSSDRLHIFKSNGKTDILKSYELKEIRSKLISLADGSDFIFMPLLHTLKNI